MRNQILNTKSLMFLLAIVLLTYGTEPVSALQIESVTLHRTTPRYHSKTPQEIASIALESTVLIETQSGVFGSGFVIDEGQVATNHHVIEDMISGTAQLVGSATKYTIEGVLALDIPHDLAIIQVRGLSAPALPLGDSDALQIGQDVYVAGNPEGFTGTFSEGIISAIRAKLLQITAPISAGSSGGPVLDRNAEVIGIAVSGHVTAQNLNFAIPVNYLKELLKRIEDGFIPPITELTDGFIYWTDWGTNKIQRANLDGSNVQTLVTRGLESPSGIAVDVAGGKMYWTDYGTNRIQRANLDGSNVQTLVTRGLENPADIALDVTGGKMYWTDFGETGSGARYGKENIKRANLDGSNIETLVTRSQGLQWPEGIALAVAGGKMYWADYNARRIQRANLDGSNIETLVTRGLENPSGIAVDAAGGKMYWTDYGAGRIQRANLDGSNIETLVTRGLESPNGIAVDAAGGKMYWTDYGETGSGARYGKENIKRANLDGSNIETLVTRADGLDSLGHIAVGVPSQVSPPLAQQSDLVVKQPTVSKGTLVPGENFTLSATVRNEGAGSAAATTLRYYRSTDATISTSDTEVGTDSVSGLGVNESSAESISLTAPTSPGTYYYGACVEVVTDESSSANNCSTSVSIAVELPNLILSVSTTSPLTEANLDGSVVTLTLSGRTFERPFDGLMGGQAVAGIRGVTVSGIPGLTIPTTRVPFNIFINGVQQIGTRYAIDRISDTELEVELAFDGTDFDTDAALTFTVEAAAIENYDSSALTAQVPVTAIKGFDFDLSLPAGISLIHVPLKVKEIDGTAKTIESVSDFYDALGGEDNVIYLFTRDSQTQQWIGYLKPSDRGTSVDRELTDDMGIITNLITPVPLRLRGSSLGTNGVSTITLNPGINLVGVPLRDSRITHVSDLFALEGIADNVLVIMAQDNNGEFKQINPTSSSTDIEISGGQSFIMTALRKDTVTISGEGWTNGPEAAAAPSMAMMGIEVSDVTPILALSGSIVDKGGGVNNTNFRVIVKNRSTGRSVATVTGREYFSHSDMWRSKGVGYRLADVDLETARAASIGDVLEISAQSSHPLIGVEPLQYAVTAEDIRRGWIQLPSLVAYEIPSETQLLRNYPNPFNPETWIPYRLAEDAFVSLTIYDLNGQAVRTIDVGHQTAAVYENRSKAVYWDGRNGLGEQVASGVYFYHLSAGDYSATRKMIILK